MGGLFPHPSRALEGFTVLNCMFVIVYWIFTLVVNGAWFQVVFRGGEGALQVLPPLIDVIPEARLNLVIYYLKQGMS